METQPLQQQSEQEPKQGGYPPHLQPIPGDQQLQQQQAQHTGSTGTGSSRSDENQARPAGPPIRLRQGEQWALIPAVPDDLTVPPGLEYLLPCKRAHVRQKMDLVEVFTSFDTPNKYAIYNDQGHFMYYAREQQRGGDFFAAQFLRDSRGFYFTVMDGLGRPAFSIARSSKMWTNCEMRVDAPPGKPAGYVTYVSTMCSRGVLTIYDRTKRPVLSIPFPDACDCGGARGYPVVSGSGSRVGAIVRQYPGFMQHAFTTCDNFALQFPLDLDVRIKCTLLACAIMIDFIDFEDKGRNSIGHYRSFIREKEGLSRDDFILLSAVFQAMAYLKWLLGVVILQMVNSIPCYKEIQSSKAMYRRHGPFLVKNQYQCALACTCASGVEQSYDNCTVFNPPIPAVHCHAYSYDFNSTECALLGGERPNMCAEPVTIYEMGKCAANPKCGSTTLDRLVICDTEGYKCPSGYLPYFVHYFSHGDQPRFGGQFVFFNGTSWIYSSTYGLRDCDRTDVQNVTCLPAQSHSYPACDMVGDVPWMFDALVLKDTFGCFPGLKYFYASYGSNVGSVYSPPICTPDGWRMGPGGALMAMPITSVYCRNNSFY